MTTDTPEALREAREALARCVHSIEAMRPLFSQSKDEGHAYHDQVRDNAKATLSRIDAALASDHIGNSTTMVPTLGVEGAARDYSVDEPMGDGTYLFRTTLTGERHIVHAATGFVWVKLPYDYRFTDNATQHANARAIIAAMEKQDGATLGVEGVAQIIRQHLNAPVSSCALLDIDEAARAIIAARGKNDGATLGVAQIKATIWKHWRNQNGQTLEDRFTSAAEEIATLVAKQS